MNIFRFIADMLHLSAILILLYRIKKSRNCIGKSPLTLIRYRSLMQDTRTVPDCFLRQISRSLHVLHKFVQHVHENFLHFVDSLHHLPDALQKALLHCKYRIYSP